MLAFGIEEEGLTKLAPELPPENDTALEEGAIFLWK
jgi:hypothetical protein